MFLLLTTVIPPVHRALGIDEAISDYSEMAGEFTNLRDRFRQAALISGLKPFDEFEADAKPLLARLEEARRNPLTPPQWFFTLARRQHKAGHYSHDYDQQKKPGST